MSIPYNCCLAVLLAALLLTGCSSISEAQAEAAAAGFVKERVKFYSRDANASVTVQDYTITDLDSVREQGFWVVSVSVAVDEGNSTKAKTVPVKVNMQGQVVELNGEQVRPG